MMSIIEVQTNREKRDFFKVAQIIYKHDNVWVCPLYSEIESIFTPSENPEFKEGEAIRWVLKNEKGDLIGRVAAFYNHRKAKIYDQPMGGIGFFECIENKKAAYVLFDKAKDWLQSKGMEGMDGPINFGENDSHWGLLVKGFTHQGIGMPYHHKYYKEFFEEYGFRIYFEQYSFHLNIGDVNVFPERFMKIAERVASQPGYSYKHFSFKEVNKFVADLVEIYNSTWNKFKDYFTPMDPDEVVKTLRKGKPIIDEELIWFAYHNEKPIAFFVVFPDFNQILKQLNGRLDIIGSIKFLYYKYTHKMTRMRALVAGVKPEYQNKGIETPIFKHLYEVFRKKTYYKELELSWVGDYNPKMKSMYNALGASHAKTHHTYRYLFDRNKKFKRYMEEVAYVFHNK